MNGQSTSCRKSKGRREASGQRRGASSREASWRACIALACALFFVGCFDAGGTTGGEEDTGISGGDALTDTVGESDTGSTEDGETDAGGEGCPPEESEEWLPDEDGDGFGDESAEPTEACEQPEGMVLEGGDCDDGNADVHPEADEICNGRDDDCDGVADADEDEIAPRDCALSEGVCADTPPINECTSDGEEYVTCGAEQYGDAYRADDDEAWRCDGADNDCDGETDEACCGVGSNDATPTPVELGEQGADLEFPDLVEPAQGAPSDAQFMAAWMKAQTVQVRHLDEEGGELASDEISVPEPVQGVATARTEQGYRIAVAYGAPTGTDYELVLYRYDESLERKQPFEVGLDTVTGDRNLAEVDVAVDDGTAWVSYSATVGSNWRVKIVGVRTQDGNVTTSPVFLSESGRDHATIPETSVAVVDGQPTVIWTDSDPGGLLRGARLDPQSGSLDTKFKIEEVVTGSDEPATLTSHDGNAVLVYERFSDDRSDPAKLVFNEIAPAETGTIGGGIPLTDNADSNKAAQIELVDSDGDGTDDELMMVWLRGHSEDPSVVVGTTDLGAPDTMPMSPIHDQVGDEIVQPRLALADEKGAVLWLKDVDFSERYLRYAPLSIDGTAICLNAGQ